MRARSAALVLCALILQGCLATVSSELTVRSATEVSSSVTVSFEGAAAEGLSPEGEAEVLSLLEEVSSGPVTVERGDEAVLFSAGISYTELVAASGLTGVSSAFLSVSEDQQDGVLTVRLTEPVRLLAAVEAAAAGQPDGGALLGPMTDMTRVALVVSFPGGLTDVVAPPGIEPVLSEGGVTISQPVGGFIAGELLFAGSLASGPRFATGEAVLLVVSAAVLAAAVILFRRRP